MLQKITTGAPVLLVLVAILAATTIKDGVRFLSLRKVACLIIAISIPLFLGAWWTSYAGSIRALNYYGKITTFARQHEYYLGHFSDRVNLSKLKAIFWDRILVQNAAGFFGIALLYWCNNCRHEPYENNIGYMYNPLCASNIVVFQGTPFIDCYQTVIGFVPDRRVGDSNYGSGLQS